MDLAAKREAEIDAEEQQELKAAMEEKDDQKPGEVKRRR